MIGKSLEKSQGIILNEFFFMLKKEEIKCPVYVSKHNSKREK